MAICIQFECDFLIKGVFRLLISRAAFRPSSAMTDPLTYSLFLLHASSHTRHLLYFFSTGLPGFFTSCGCLVFPPDSSPIILSVCLSYSVRESPGKTTSSAAFCIPRPTDALTFAVAHFRPSRLLIPRRTPTIPTSTRSSLRLIPTATAPP